MKSRETISPPSLKQVSHRVSSWLKEHQHEYFGVSLHSKISIATQNLFPKRTFTPSEVRNIQKFVIEEVAGITAKRRSHARRGNQFTRGRVRKERRHHSIDDESEEDEDENY
jgi:hypothetical protein